MKKLLMGLAVAGAGYAVYALSKSGKLNHMKLSPEDLPEPVKRKLKESAAVSADALKNSSEKVDEALVHIAKIVGSDEERVQELIAKIGTMSEAKKKELLELIGKFHKKTS